MKQRILKENVGIVGNDSNIGIRWSNKPGETGFRSKVILIKVKESNYVGMDHSLDISRCWDTSSKNSYCTKVLSKSNEDEIYLFDNTAELIRWLVDKNN